MIFTRSHGFVFYLTLFFWTSDLFAAGQEDKELSAQKFPSISYMEQEVDTTHRNNKSRGKGNFDVLADEGIVLIFEFLYIKELGRLASTSAEIKRLSEDDSLWRAIAAKQELPLTANKNCPQAVKQMVRESFCPRWVKRFQSAR